MEQAQPTIEEMTLEQLKTDITSLSDEELLEYIQGTRNNRNTAPPPKTKKASAKKKASPLEEEMLALMEALGMSEEDLLNMLNEGNK